MQRSFPLAVLLISLSANGLAPIAVAQTAPSAEQIRQQDARSEAEWYYSVGIQNYVFALPLTIMERERNVRLNPAALEQAKKVAPAAPINQIGNMRTLATADDIMPYTPNNDTVYSGAFLELAGGAIILTAPDIADRYWSVEVADAYTNPPKESPIRGSRSLRSGVDLTRTSSMPWNRRGQSLRMSSRPARRTCCRAGTPRHSPLG
jgi:hypothetical protein